ncbi:MAG: hypothetical protein U1E22_03570 [Coriobacteriia bacterium]|nr:hypothetical protein [Coriobacteriia bacterium]
MDFTLKTYEKLLKSLLMRGFSFMTFAQYIEAKSSNPPIFESSNPKEPSKKEKEPSFCQTKFSNPHPPRRIKSSNLILLRHDVEARYPNALRMAEIEHKLGIKGSYYFRIFQKAGNEEIIKQIASMGHEVGYHYDDLTACNGNQEKALLRFQKNLAYLRQFAPVSTITMEGAPLSKYDNRDLWNQPLSPEIAKSQGKSKKSQVSKDLNPQILIRRGGSNPQIPNPSLFTIHYSLFNIIAEPYFDLDFDQIFYLTDTGRRWDGHRYNIRDKATKEKPVTNPTFLQLRFHSTFDLINAINASDQQINKSTNQQFKSQQTFPPHAMLNFHPQRWNDKPVPWLKELVWQNIKNQGKRMLLAMRK